MAKGSRSIQSGAEERVRVCAEAGSKRVVYADNTERNYGYDDAGRKTSDTDPEGVITQYGYDGLGRLVSVKLAFGLADETTTSYAYDEAGNLITQTDGKNQATQFRYDAFGRRVKRTLPEGQ